MANVVLTAGSGWRVSRPWPIAVDLAGEPAPPLALVEVAAGRGAEGVAGTFEWTGPSADFGLARQLVIPGQRIRARYVRSSWSGGIADWPIFDGYVVGVRTEFDGGGRRILLDAIDGVRFRYGGQALCGRHAFDSTGEVVFAPDLPLVFNRAGRPDRSDQQATINGRSCFVFEGNSSAAAFWSAADIIDYLLATRLAGDALVALPSSDRLQAVCADCRPHSLDVTGQGVLAALERLGELSNSRFAIEPQQSVLMGGLWQMRWFAASGARLIVLYHQPAGEPVTVQTNVWSGSLDFPHDGAQRVWTAVGEPERVESTFDLVGGWDAGLEGGGHADYSQGSAQFPAVRDVYRRWVLNEAGDWTGSPFNRGPAADLSAVFGTNDYLLAHRKLLACLSRDASGKSFGVAVQVSFDGGATWGAYPGRIEVLSGEAGVWIADSELPPDYWQAARVGTLAVRVTATIESDIRVRAELVDAPQAAYARTIRRLCWLPGRFHHQWVGPGSQFAGGPADEIDDRDELAAALAERIRRDPAAGAHGRLTLPWLTGVYQIGDRIRGISGQGLSFNTGNDLNPREPLVARLRHLLGPNWQTTLELE